MDGRTGDTGDTGDTGIESDLSQWPVVLLHVPATADNEDIRSFLVWWDEQVIRRGEDYVLVLDQSALQRFSAVQRKLVTDTMEAHRDAAAHCLGLALVIHTDFAREMMDAIIAATHPPYPIRAFHDLDEADGWVRGLLP